MKSCPFCAYPNREGVLFCEECGHPFTGSTQHLSTRVITSEQAQAQGRITWGTARFSGNSSIVVQVRDYSEPVILGSKEELMVGRADTQSNFAPDLDLDQYGGADQGVSRRHAVIRRGEDTLTLTDLGSTNGTYLNGQRLLPNQSRVLRDGDEVRAGRLVFHIFFK